MGDADITVLSTIIGCCRIAKYRAVAMPTIIAIRNPRLIHMFMIVTL